MAGIAPRIERRRHVSVGTRVGRVLLITITIAFLALLLLAVVAVAPPKSGRAARLA